MSSDIAPRNKAPGRLAPANLVLTGFMGTGKSTVARLLADELGREFVDTDAVITERHGPICDIFAEQGEQAFRQMERLLAQELAGRDNLVVATGGGMLLDPEAAKLIGRRARVFCLTAEPDTILARVTVDVSGPARPLIAANDPAGSVVALLAEREARYRSFEPVPTDGRTPAEVATEIVNRLAPRSDARGQTPGV